MQDRKSGSRGDGMLKGGAKGDKMRKERVSIVQYTSNAGIYRLGGTQRLRAVGESRIGGVEHWH